ELDEAFAPPDVPGVLTNERSVRRRRGLRIGGAGTFIVLALGAASSLAGSRGSASLPTFRQLTFRHGTIGGARLAADGQTVVYRATWTGTQPELYVLRPESRQSGSIGLVNAGIYSVS